MANCNVHVSEELRFDRFGCPYCHLCAYDNRNRCKNGECKKVGSDRYSYRVYAGHYCDKCWRVRRLGFRDQGSNNRPDSDLDEEI